MRRRLGEHIGYGLLAAALTVGAWWAWLGWDHEYQFDANGVASGPYEAWQVVGLALTLGAIAAGTAWRVWFFVVAPVMAAALTITWSLNAAAQDDTGLWAVGAILVALGTLAGTGLVAGLVNAIRGRVSRRGGPEQPPPPIQ